MSPPFVALGARFRTGQRNPVSGAFRFDGYVDGARWPIPTPLEMEIPLAAGHEFPPIHSAAKSCWWKLIRKL